MLSCREVTRLVSESQERKLTVGERLSMNLHFAMCEGCKNFSLQMPFLRKAIRAYSERLDELVKDNESAGQTDDNERKKTA